MNGYSEEEIELGKLFDSLMQMKAIKEDLLDKDGKTTVEIDGKEYDAENIADNMRAAG